MENRARENIAGYPITTGSKKVCVEQVLSWITSGQRRKYLVCANPHSLELARSDHLFKKAIISADLLTPDGIGIILASRIHGGCIRDRVTGSDIFLGLSDALNRKKGYRYFFLGSTEKTLALIRDKMRIEFPNIEVAGTFSPLFKPQFTPAENRKMMAARISTSIVKRFASSNRSSIITIHEPRNPWISIWISIIWINSI